MSTKTRLILIVLAALVMTACQFPVNQSRRGISLLHREKFGIMRSLRSHEKEYADHVAQAVKANVRRPAKIVPWDGDVLWLHRSANGTKYLLVMPSFSVPFDNAWLARVRTIGPFWWVTEWEIPFDSRILLAVEAAINGLSQK
jgi:hypothetical protein